MAALLSFDTEFTHPVPTVGALLQLGAVCVAWDEETMTAQSEPAGVRIKLDFPIGDDAVITPWVAENQADLVTHCRALRDEVRYEDQAERLRTFLRRAAEKFGAPLIPAGWCLGSDMAYLLHVLGRENELVHYSAIDLKALAIPLTGKYDLGDKELGEFLGVGPPENEHDALADALYQMKLLLAAFRMVRESTSTA